jgi:hypothetical protein
LFFLAKMSQDAIDNVLVVNTGDDLYRSTTAIANFNVDIDTRLSRWAHALETATDSLTGQLNPLFQFTIIGTIVRVEHALFRLAHLNEKHFFILGNFPLAL